MSEPVTPSIIMYVFNVIHNNAHCKVNALKEKTRHAMTA